MSTKAPVAIIGAGPGGLTFARLLEVNSIDYIVYERDVSPDPKFINQGGCLDIHGSSGQQAIKEADLFEEFKKFARWDATRVCMQNPSGTAKIVFGQDRDAPEIDRLHLRKMLLDSIPAHKVHWDHSVKSIEKGDAASNHVIHFHNGTSSSGFRLILTSARPQYSGKVYIEGSISHDNPSYAAALAHAGPGTMLAMGDYKMLAVQQLADRSYCFFMGMKASEDEYKKAMSLKETEAVRQKFLFSSGFFENWAPNLKEYIRNAEGPFHAWPLKFLPASSISWTHVLGLTLIGDAAHLSTPHVGEGVNHAMFDALMLIRAIKKHCGPGEDLVNNKEQLELALGEYEKEMFVRGQDHIQRCMAREKELFSENAAEDLVETIDATMKNEHDETK